ncbi:MAG: hypothetical protein IPK94_07505 [Saprospiraceae bacterium]|nr:hypothetical protein [Saprospiraceae bacterium]
MPQEYLYNGKELDDETGMYYYGAKYYDPGLSFWSSVDPMVDKYPGVTPYNYVLGNPLLLKDNIGKSATIAGAVLGFVINGTANGIVNYYSTGSILEASKAAL